MKPKDESLKGSMRGRSAGNNLSTAEPSEVRELEGRVHSYRVIARLSLYGMFAVVVLVLISNFITALIEPATQTNLLDRFWQSLTMRPRSARDVDPPAPPLQVATAVEAEEASVTPPISESLHAWSEEAISSHFDRKGQFLVRVPHTASDFKPLQLVNLEQRPVAVAVLRDFGKVRDAKLKWVGDRCVAIVIVQDEPLVILVDALTGRTLAKLNPVFIPMHVAVGKGDEPSVILYNDFEICRFNPASRSFSDRITLPQGHSVPFEHCIVSDDGQTIWAQSSRQMIRRIQWPIDSVKSDAAIVHPEVGLSGLLSDCQFSSHPILVMRDGLSYGDSLQRIYQRQDQFGTILADTCYVFGANANEYRLYNINDGVLVTRLDRVYDTIDSLAPPQSHATRTRTLSDAEKHRADAYCFRPEDKTLLLSHSRQLAILRLSTLDLPRRPILLPTVPIPFRWMVGTEWSHDLNIREPDAKVTMMSAPDAMVLEGRKVRWKPALKQVGTHTAQLSISSGEAMHALSMKVEVSNPFIELAWPVENLIFSDDGRWCVAWRNFFPLERLDNGTCQIAIIDAKRFEVVRETTLKQPVQSLCATSDRLYVAVEGRIIEAELPSMTPVRQMVSREWADTPVGQVSTVGKNPLILVALDTVVVDRQSFQLPTAGKNADRGGVPSATTLEIYGRTGAGWIVRGIVENDEGQPQLLAWPADFRFGVIANDLIARANRDLRGPMLLRRHKLVAEAFSKEMASDRFPVLLARHEPIERPGFVEVIEDQNRLLIGWGSQSGASMSFLPLALKSEGDTVIASSATELAVAKGRQLFRMSWDDLRQDNVNVFRIVNRQSRWTLNPEVPTMVNYQAEGAVEYRVSFPEYDETVVRSENGEFNIDLRKQLHRIVKRHVEQDLELPSIKSLKSPTEFNRHRDRSRPAFRRLTGEDNMGMVIPVRVQVDALSADFQSDQLAHDFLIDLPHDQLSLLIEQEELREAIETLYQTFRWFLDRMQEFPSLRKAYNDL